MGDTKKEKYYTIERVTVIGSIVVVLVLIIVVWLTAFQSGYNTGINSILIDQELNPSVLPTDSQLPDLDDSTSIVEETPIRDNIYF